jgi:hypothetical protein
MRYSLRFANGDPFPQDLSLGIELDDEPVVEVPEPVICDECPECPEPCEVECWGWLSIRSDNAGFSNFANFASQSTIDNYLGLFGGVYPISAYLSVPGEMLTLLMQGNFCGHKIRYVLDLNGNSATVAHIPNGPGSPFATWGETALRISAITGSNDMFVQPQIDLTDAATGEETWTDVCHRVRIVPGGV